MMKNKCVVLRTDIEKDAEKLMMSLNDDYEIPSSWTVNRPVLKAVSLVLIIMIVASVINSIVYRHSDDPMDILFGGVFFSLLASIILSLFALMMTYGNLSILMCIPKDVRDKSLLIGIGKRKLKTYGYVIVAINVVVAIVLISGRSDFIIGYGVSWFVSMIVGGITFSMSMSRYMTPAVVATLDKIRQVVSSGEGAPAEHADPKQGH